MTLHNFVVYFEIFGKKMKTTVEARNSFEVDKIIKDKVLINKIEKVEVPNDQFLDMFRDIFKM